MRILIVSDTHGHNGNFQTVYDKVKPVDMVWHLGDLEGTEYELEEMVDCPFYAVAGNNDFFTELPRERELEVGKYRVFLCHGHYYRVSMTSRLLADEAKARGCNIAVYGHTHRPLIERGRGIDVINPGSLSYPRQDGRRPSYIMMDIDREGEAHYMICYL